MLMTGEKRPPELNKIGMSIICTIINTGVVWAVKLLMLIRTLVISDVSPVNNSDSDSNIEREFGQIKCGLKQNLCISSLSTC